MIYKKTCSPDSRVWHNPAVLLAQALERIKLTAVPLWRFNCDLPNPLSTNRQLHFIQTEVRIPKKEIAQGRRGTDWIGLYIHSTTDLYLI